MVPFAISGCSAAVEVIGKILADWDIPILTEAGISANLEDKTIFSTLTRMAYNMHKFASFYSKVLDHFNWTDISLLYENEHYPAWFFADSTNTAFRDTHFNVRLLKVEFVRGRDHIRGMLKAASAVSRSTYNVA